MTRVARFFAPLVSWLRAALGRERLESAMDSELRFHIESYIQDLVRSGVPASDAARRAYAEFGSVALHKDAMRDSLGLRWWDDLRADLRYAFRALGNSPGFAAVAVASLALGIGANTAIFSLTSRLLLARLAVPHPRELRLLSWAGGEKVAVHSLWGNWNESGGRISSTSFSYPVYRQLRLHNSVLGDLFAFKGIGRVNVTAAGAAESVQAEMVSGNYYRELGVKTQLGRPIEPADDGAPGSGPVVVISDGFWARRFGRSRRVLGTVIAVNLTPLTIVGVNPPGFTGAQGTQGSPEIFLPFSMQPIVVPRQSEGSLLANTDLWWMQIMARARPGVADATAQASLDVALSAAVRATMTLGAGDRVPRLALSDGSRGLDFASRTFSKPIYVLMSLAGLVLLLACANIANLLLARAASRQREMSVRLALGAGRGRILRQVLTESLALASLGGAAGLLLGYLGRNVIPALLANPWERNDWASGFDWRVFAFTAVVTLATGLLFGIAPAWRATRSDAGPGLKESAHTTTRRRTGLSTKSLVAFQVSLSTLLVAGAVLFLRTLGNLDSAPLGFDANNLLLFAIDAPVSRYPPPQDIAVYRRIEEALAAVPGAGSVTLSTVPLIADSMTNDDFIPTGRPKGPEHSQVAFLNVVGNRFFATFRTPILAGRDFNSRDTESSPKVAIVNRALARQFFPNSTPIGKTFTTRDSTTGKDILVRIAGVCADARYAHLRDDPAPLFYLPYRQLGSAPNRMTYEIRTRVKHSAIVPSLRRAVRSIDRDLPLIDIRTQREQIDATVQQERIFASLGAAFGLLALALAAIGVYGVMAYSVARRTHEIGIRLALGAQVWRVLWMVLGETSWIALAGVASGLATAAALTPLIRSMLYGVKPADPVSLAGASLLLFAAALAAGFVPARRAALVEPLAALRHE